MKSGSRAKPVGLLEREDRPGHGSLRSSAATSTSTSAAIVRAVAHLAARDVVHDAAVAADRQPVAADVGPQLLHPADRAAGDEDDRHAEAVELVEHRARAGGDGAVGVRAGCRRGRSRPGEGVTARPAATGSRVELVALVDAGSGRGRPSSTGRHEARPDAGVGEARSVSRRPWPGRLDVGTRTDPKPRGSPGSRARTSVGHRPAGRVDEASTAPGAGADCLGGPSTRHSGAVKVNEPAIGLRSVRAAGNHRDSSTAAPSSWTDAVTSSAAALHLLDGLPHRDAATGPAQHLDVVAPVADREHVGRAERRAASADVLEAGGLGDADRATGRARRSSRRRSRCRAGRASAASSTKSSAVASGSRMITRLTGSPTMSSTSVMIMLAGELALGEVPVDAVADAALLDRDQRVGVVLAAPPRPPARRRRSPRGRPRSAGSGTRRRRWTPRPRAGRRSSRGRSSRSAIAGHAVRRAAAGQHDVGAGVEGAVHGVVDRRGDLLVVVAGARRPT